MEPVHTAIYVQDTDSDGKSYGTKTIQNIRNAIEYLEDNEDSNSLHLHCADEICFYTGNGNVKPEILDRLQYYVRNTYPDLVLDIKNHRTFNTGLVIKKTGIVHQTKAFAKIMGQQKIKELSIACSPIIRPLVFMLWLLYGKDIKVSFI